MSKGGLSSAAGSRKFEYGGESVLSLSRDDDTEDAQGRVPATLTLEKNRNGVPGKLRLRFHGALQRFDQAER
jgi:replicative DNA helicase